MINKLNEIRDELLTGVQKRDLIYIKMQINKIDTLIYNASNNNDISPLVIMCWWDSLTELQKHKEANIMFNPDEEWRALDELNLTDDRIKILYKNSKNISDVSNQNGLLSDFYYRLSQRADTNLPPINIFEIVDMYENGNL